uniref:MarR family winged helix-turn-helix transcriptional regulator n=1 Tax=Pararhizobium sp. IMCC3301 TaxID=3067904 RepID=UPI00274062BB|nr:MarR family transcriptional regulator [Pararhizobium sp. IMCC3301]
MQVAQKRVISDSSDKFVENVFGVFSRALCDKMDAAVQAAVKLSSSACYSIVQVGSEPNCSIETLRRMLALEHSSVVRLVSGLEKKGFLQRVRGTAHDRREVSVVLTEEGEICFTRILEARGSVLKKAVGRLDPDEQHIMLKLIGKMMPAVVIGGDDQHYVCRLCDLEICPQEKCPVNLAHPQFYELPPEPFKRKRPCKIAVVN